MKRLSECGFSQDTILSINHLCTQMISMKLTWNEARNSCNFRSISPFEKAEMRFSAATLFLTVIQRCKFISTSWNYCRKNKKVRILDIKRYLCRWFHSFWINWEFTWRKWSSFNKNIRTYLQSNKRHFLPEKAHNNDNWKTTLRRNTF